MFSNTKYPTDQVLLDDGKLRAFFRHLDEAHSDRYVAGSRDYDALNSIVQQTVWSDGSESHTFNRLEEIAMQLEPKTPILGARISRALDTKVIGRDYLTSRINWVVQSSAVDFLHLLITSMEWFMQKFDIKGRYVISIHDEIRYMVESEDRYKAALAMHLSNLLVRSHVVASLGLTSLPTNIAFFSSVDVDTVLRKEPSSDCKTPSNPHGLLLGHGIPPGEGLDIHQVLRKLQPTNSDKK